MRSINRCNQKVKTGYCEESAQIYREVVVVVENENDTGDDDAV